MSTRQDTHGRIEIRHPSQRQRIVDLSGRTLLIGRDPSCGIWLADSEVSRRHAQIQRAEGGGWVLQDLGSRNGTLVSGVSITQALLTAGDRIQIGACELILRADAAPDVEEPMIEFVEEETVPVAQRPLWHIIKEYSVLARNLNRMSDVEDLVRCLCNGCRRMCHARQASIGLFTGEEVVWHTITTDETESSSQPHLPMEILQRLRDDSLTFEELRQTGTVDIHGTVEGMDALLFPLRSAGVTYGILFLEVPTGGLVDRPQEAGLVRLAAMEAANCLGRIEARQLERRQQEMMADLNAARTIQLSLFPRSLNLDPRVEIGAINRPSAQVSGDYYDMRKIANDRLLFLLADVSGHGLAAAMVMANFQAGFRLCARMFENLQETHLTLGRLVEENAPAGVFVTGILGLLDLSCGRLSISTAGHPPPVEIGGNDGFHVPDECGTLPWGVPPQEEPQVHETNLQEIPGALMLYTDGVTEVTNASDELLGLDGLRRILRKVTVETLQERVERVSDEVALWSNGNIADDMTILALRYCG